MFILSSVELASIHQHQPRPSPPQLLHTASFITSLYTDTTARQLHTHGRSQKGIWGYKAPSKNFKILLYYHIEI